MTISKWQLVKDFVNANNIFTTSDIRKKLNTGYTGSLYILHLMNAGFLKRIERGKYQKIITIPKYITSSYLQKLAYNDIEKKKIMTILARKEKLVILSISSTLYS